MASVPREIGTLIVVLLKARNLPNKRHIGKQDPYCSVQLNGERRRTKAIKRGGQHPEWDEEVRFTLMEAEGPDPTAPSSRNGSPPPPPKKNERGIPNIQGGRFMYLSCWAEDVREPDFIGETKVDLSEVLTKGETDEWFTLTNKDKYSGEVYLELTFWSNEPAPVKKPAAKPKTQKQYGGPGTFVPSSESSLAVNKTGSVSSHIQISPTPTGRPRRESIPANLQASSSFAKLDLYTAPYETYRSHHSMQSVDSMTSEFAEMGVQGTGGRRTSYPPTQGSFGSGHSPSSSVGYGHSQATPSYNYTRHSSYSDDGTFAQSRSYTPPESQLRHQASLPMQPTGYQAPYETQVAQSIPARGPRQSIPTSSSGFMPIPAASSGFSLSVQPTGYVPSVSPSPGSIPFPRQEAAPHPAPTPAPYGYGPVPSQTPAPSSSFPQLSQPYPSQSPFPSSATYNAISRSQSTHPYQQYAPSSIVAYSSQTPLSPSHISQPPPTPFPPMPQQASVTGMQQRPPLPQIPPPPPLNHHAQVAPVDQRSSMTLTNAIATLQQANIPPPPPLSANGQGSRPLPTPAPSPMRSRRQSLPVPPSQLISHSPTGVNPIYNSQIPPPPPLPTAQTGAAHHSVVQHGTIPPPPSLSHAKSASPLYPANSPSNLVLPPAGQQRRTSLPPTPVPLPGAYAPPSAYEQLSRVPPPPQLPPQSQSTMTHQNHQALVPSFPASNSGYSFYPGPLPKPPMQHITPSQSMEYPAVVPNWRQF